MIHALRQSSLREQTKENQPNFLFFDWVQESLLIQKMKMPVNPGYWEALPEIPKALIEDLMDAARNAKIKRMAFVGGAVRDGLLRRSSNYLPTGTNDIDLVVEGSATKIAEELNKNIDKNRTSELITNNIYDSAKITLDGLIIDISSSRKEIYKFPGANPTVSDCPIERDLLRRDFSVNAIAIEIPKGEIIDVLNGVNSLHSKKLSFLHQKSVEEDPTRVIRAARYAAKLGFSLTNESIKQIESTISNWPWDWKQGDNPDKAPPALSSRLRMELELTLSIKSWAESLTLLKELGGLQFLDKRLNKEPNLHQQVRMGKRMGLSSITTLVANTSEPLAIAIRLGLPIHQQQVIKDSIKLKSLIRGWETNGKCSSWLPSQWSQVIESENLKPESIALTACMKINNWKPLIRWWASWRHVKPEISAKELIDNGWRQGPELGNELKRLRYKRIDNLFCYQMPGSQK